MLKKWLACVLSGLILVGCADTGPKAPKEGRLSLDTYQREDVNMTSSSMRIGPLKKNEVWSSVYAYTTNNRPHVALPETVKQKWRISIGEGVSSNGVMQVAPIVVQDTIYTLDSHFVLQATRMSDGQRLWRKELPVSDRSVVKSVGLTRDKGNLYLVSGDGQIVSLDGEGKLNWEQKTNMSLRTGPVVVGNRLFVTSLNNDVIALDKRNGKMLWTLAGQGAATTFLGMATPAVSEEMIVVPTTTGLVNTYTVDGGGLRWSETMWHARTFSLIQDLPHVSASPVIDGKNVYLIGNAGKMGAYRLVDGRALWTKPIGGRTTPLVSGTALFLIDNQNQLKAMDTRNGHCYWDKKLSASDVVWQGPVIAGGKLILTSSQGDIVWFDAISGEELRRDKIAPIGVAPVIVQDKMLVLTSDGNLYLYQ